MLIIRKPQITTEKSYTTYSCLIEIDGKESPLWMRVADQWHEFVSERSDAALLALLMPAMAAGHDIHVEGPVSQELVEHINDRAQAILLSVFGHLKKITVLAPDMMPACTRAAGVAAGLSCGVDSLCTIADYLPSAGRSLALTHLIHNDAIVRSEKASLAQPALHERIVAMATSLDLPVIFVASNMSSFCTGKGLNYSRVHTLQNAAAAALLQRGIGVYLYASAYAYHEVHSSPATSTAWADPILLPNLSTGALHFQVSGSEYLRVEKMVRVATLVGARKHLHVCMDETQTRNCSACIKCAYAQITLERMGRLEEFSDCFDKATYQRIKHEMLGKILSGRSPYRIETREFLCATGFRFGWRAWLSAIRHRRQFKDLIWGLFADRRRAQLVRDRISSSQFLNRNS